MGVTDVSRQPVSTVKTISLTCKGTTKCYSKLKIK